MDQLIETFEYVRLYRNNRHRDSNVSVDPLDTSHDAARTIMRKTLLARLNSIFMFLKSLVFGAQLDIKVKGIQNIDQALAKGNGVILWVADLVNAGDLCKIALANKNYQISHLSRPEHGFSDTRFGLAILNPIR